MSESLLNWSDYLQVASLSDVGMRRKNNQDNFSVSLANSLENYQRKGHLFVVADGMGAHAAGELASKLAIDHIPHLYQKYESESAAAELERAVLDANAEIYRRGQANEEFHNMGTTCSVLTLSPVGAMVAHVGDSRIYRLSQNRLEQLTFDHSLVWELRAAGQLSADEEKSGRIPRNVITRSLGPNPEVKVDLEGPFPVQLGDVFLLCSDGLTGVLQDAEIAAILANIPPAEAVQVLVDLANLRGGPDNITVVVVKINHQQLVTTAGNQVPRVATQRRKDPAVAPVVWALLAACLFFTLLFYFFANPGTALLPASVAVITLVYMLYRWLVRSTTIPAVPHEYKRNGKGPYTRVSSPGGVDFVKQLAQTLDQLKQGAIEQGWRVNWGQWKTMIEKAEGAFRQNDFPAAIQDYSRAISFLMDQLRNQRDDASDGLFSDL